MIRNVSSALKRVRKRGEVEERRDREAVKVCSPTRILAMSLRGRMGRWTMLDEAPIALWCLGWERRGCVLGYLEFPRELELGG